MPSMNTLPVPMDVAAAARIPVAILEVIQMLIWKDVLEALAKPLVEEKEESDTVELPYPSYRLDSSYRLPDGILDAVLAEDARAVEESKSELFSDEFSSWETLL